MAVLDFGDLIKNAEITKARYGYLHLGYEEKKQIAGTVNLKEQAVATLEFGSKHLCKGSREAVGPWA